MPQARYRLVDTRTTPYYHCVSRCVRRAFLCGVDRWSGKNFDHRKQWILDRIKQLSSVFAIDVCAYAIMSNHFHLVVHVDSSAAKLWSSDEILDRWLTLHRGPFVAQKYREGKVLSRIEHEALSTYAETWRARLTDLSWFMRCLNESIARLANAEDQCTGRFWEGRFKSQALLDEAALLSCMAYVDLNPIRAKTCKSLQTSEFTSIRERLNLFANNSKRRKRVCWLQPLKGEASTNRVAVPMTPADYFALVDWTGRVIRKGKRGEIPPDVSPILKQLGVDDSSWVNYTRFFEKRFRRGVGTLSRLKLLAERASLHWLHGQGKVASFNT